ncbi:MAG TPA: ATP-binding protein [Streptosporangiaceae bacterium]
MTAITAEQAARIAAAGAPAAAGRPARPGQARRAVLTALLAGVPLAGLYCVAAQWPLWEPATAGLAAVNLLVTVSFLATGVFVSAEPGHRATGVALILAALLWPVNWLSVWMTGPWPLIAALEGPLSTILAVWALLRYPAHWPRRWHEGVVIAGLAVLQVLDVLPRVTSRPEWHNGQLAGIIWPAWWPDRTAYLVTERIYNYSCVLVAIIATTALITRLARLTGPDRPVFRPVLVAIAAAGGLSIVSSLTNVIHVPHSTVITVDELEGLALASVPVAFLAASARKWLARERVLALIASLGPAPTPAQVQDVLRTALGDPALTLLYRVAGGLGVSGGLVDTRGVPTAPIAPAGGAVIPAPGGVVLLTGEPLLARYPEMIRAAASVAGLALQNTSLQAAISAQIYLVGQSAGRLDAAVDAERRRIRTAVSELCDTELAVIAGRLAELVQAGQEAAGPARSARDLLAGVVQELTCLADGTGPPELARLGLAAALTSAAARLSPRITVRADPGPLPSRVAAAAWFAACELMTNAVKHGGGCAVEVTACRADGGLLVEVRDDGPGGADPAGSGLRGLAERAVSLSGSLVVSSGPGSGTRATVRLPLC